MSIRLRLTLTYSAILALTLIVFSTLLYFSQARITMNTVQSRLASGPFFDEGRPTSLPRLADDRPRPRPRGPAVYTQIRNLAGEIMERDQYLGDEVTLPLSDAGLKVVQEGEVWTEMVLIDDERFMVRSRLVRGPDGQPRIVQIAGSLIDRDQYLETLRRVLITGSSLAVIAAFGIGWVLAGLTLRPINRIRQTAQAIGAERDFERRVDYSGPNDEIGQLATTFNGMLSELQAAFLQVEQFLKTQQQFVADASHELRTPLTTLRGNIALLQRRPSLSPEDQVDILTDMEDESDRLIRLVNDLLVLARADAKRPLRRDPVNLKPLLEDVCQQIKILAPEREVNCRPYYADLSILGDRDALKQVLLILLDNALNHTPAEADIVLTSQRVDDLVTISVRDRGSGIDPTLLPHIFDRFYQGNTARSGIGAGLGLAIAKELVEAQNGTIIVESEVGQGTVFMLKFPIRAL